MDVSIHRLLRRAVFFVSLFATLFVPVGAAFAQTASGLTIKPAVVEDKAVPGQTYTYSLSVTNEGSAQQTFYLQSQDIKGLDDNGQPVFAKEGEPTGYELSSWIGFNQNTLTLDAKQTKTITFTVTVPQKASPGAHFASVLFADRPNAISVNGSAVGVSVGAIVSLQIAGDIVEEASLQEFSTGKLVYGSAPVDFSAKVQNSGNVLVRPTGIIEISNMFGKKIDTIVVNPATGAVFPNSSRSFAATWNSSDFLFGRYQAVVSLAYGAQASKTISNTTSFWILPLGTIAIVIGSFVVIIGLLSMLTRMYVRSKLREMGVESRSDAALYRRKYQSGSRLMVVTMSVVLVCIVFLVIVFLMFA